MNFNGASKGSTPNLEQQLYTRIFGTMREIHGAHVGVDRVGNGVISGRVKRPTNIKGDVVVSLINKDADIQECRTIESIQMIVTFALLITNI